jgi:hypothetical protein
MFICNF